MATFPHHTCMAITVRQASDFLNYLSYGGLGEEK